jgi:dockerin type I repeat protein
MTVRFFVLLLALMAGPLAAADYTIHVVDADTGRGVPLVELSPQSGSTLITDSNGIAAFNQAALMNQNVSFGFRSYGYTDGNQTLHPTSGGSIQISIDRSNLAERLYRVTGTGIYQDSVQVGASVPIAQPLLNANVKGQDSVQTAIYKDQIYWFWGDTLYQSGGLGNFRTSGARSALPGQGGLDPSLGVNLNYFVNANGWSKEMMPVPDSGAMWIDGVFTVRDNDGQDRLLARNARYLDLATNVEQGLALFNDSTETFQRFQSYSLTAPITPQGHSFKHADNGEDYIYFSLTYPNVRVKANWFDVTHIANWEAYSPLRANTRYNSSNPPFDRDASGNIIFGWKKNTDPLSYEMLSDLVQRGYVTRDELPFRLKNATTSAPVQLHRSDVQWNDYRKSWVMIGVESYGSSFLGEVWFSEAPTPEGPWEKAVKVATHDRGSTGDYSFYNPSLHPFFDQAGGQYIYFEGSYTNTFSGNSNPTPLYDYNQMMYRLDLGQIPNLFPRLAGDYNRDDVVDAADYIVWRKAMQTGGNLAADGNGDGVINMNDYDVWRAHIGSTASGAAFAQAVPESPGCMLLLIALNGASGLITRRRYKSPTVRISTLTRSKSETFLPSSNPTVTSPSLSNKIE